MTLKLSIHILYNVCPILGSYKSVAQHFQSVAQHGLLVNTLLQLRLKLLNPTEILLEKKKMCRAGLSVNVSLCWDQY